MADSHQKVHVATNGHPESGKLSMIERAIAEVLPSNDPFDATGFNAISVINKYFPSDVSLNAVENTCERLNVKMTQIDAAILLAVEHQSSAAQAQQDLEVANRAHEQLVDSLMKIRTKSDMTENIVREICSDIQTLDYAKRNLTSTITAIRRLNMLETAVEQLNVMTTERAYREAANLLEAVSQLARNFEPYKRVEKICELLASVRALRSQLQAQVFEEFKMHIGSDMSEDAASMLADAALVRPFAPVPS